MNTYTSEIPGKKPRAIPAKVRAVRERILPMKADNSPDKAPDKPLKTPTKPRIPAKTTKPTMTANMPDLTQIKDTEGHPKPKKEGHPKAKKEGQHKRYKTKTTPEEIVAKHKEEHELDKTKYKTEMQAYLKERLKQGKNKLNLDNLIKQLEAKIKAA